MFKEKKKWHEVSDVDWVTLWLCPEDTNSSLRVYLIHLKQEGKKERRLNDGACDAPREEENVLYVFIPRWPFRPRARAFKKQATREDGNGCREGNSVKENLIAGWNTEEDSLKAHYTKHLTHSLKMSHTWGGNQLFHHLFQSTQPTCYERTFRPSSAFPAVFNAFDIIN